MWRRLFSWPMLNVQGVANYFLGRHTYELHPKERCHIIDVLLGGAKECLFNYWGKCFKYFSSFNLLKNTWESNYYSHFIDNKLRLSEDMYTAWLFTINQCWSPDHPALSDWSPHSGDDWALNPWGGGHRLIPTAGQLAVPQAKPAACTWDQLVTMESKETEWQD